MYTLYESRAERSVRRKATAAAELSSPSCMYGSVRLVGWLVGWLVVLNCDSTRMFTKGPDSLSEAQNVQLLWEQIDFDSTVGQCLVSDNGNSAC